MKAYQHIASLLQAAQTCLKRAEAQGIEPEERTRLLEWAERHSERIDSIGQDFLPHGSGFDDGTSVNLERSTPERIILETAFHHMTDHGYYDGWTSHTCTVRASLAHGFELSIGGRDRRGIKEVIHDCLQAALDAEMPETEFRLYWPDTAEEIIFRDSGLAEETARVRALRRYVLDRARYPGERIVLQDRRLEPEGNPWCNLGGILDGEYVFSTTAARDRKPIGGVQ